MKWADGELDRLGLSGIEDKLATKLFVGSVPKNAKEVYLYNEYYQKEHLSELFSKFG